MTKLYYLQLFAEGGGEGGADAGGSPEATVYGIQAGVADQEDTTEKPRDYQAEFEDMIKGEYKDAFAKRTQQIINQRFKETKQMQSTLDSHVPVIAKLAERYGVDPSDIKALNAALDNDTAYLEQEALEQGLSVKQLQQIKAMERENAELKAAHDAREKEERSQQIYSQWMEEAEQLKAKYNLPAFDLELEAQNPEFTSLLGSGVSLESAYKAVHFDEMLGGAMAVTAQNVKEGMARKVASRQSRPAENGTQRAGSSLFKTNVDDLTSKDIREIWKRVERGEQIRF